MEKSAHNSLNLPGNGIPSLLLAYLIWGLSPVYWKWLGHVDSFELLLHRTIWSLVFLLVIIFLQKRSGELIAILKTPKLIGFLTFSTLILAINWYLFIWAINHGQILQTSLAYYMNPLLMVFLGMLFLRERLNRRQAAALFLACAGVGYYTVSLGHFPWIAIIIAGSFGLYGLIHKLMPVLPLPGLCIETLLLSVPALGYLIYLHQTGTGAMFSNGFETDLLLVGTCLVTGLPLLVFTIGTKRSTLTTVGFMQYIAPSCTFLLAVFYYQEGFSVQKLTAFTIIWTALAIYSIDTLVQHRHNKRVRLEAISKKRF